MRALITKLLIVCLLVHFSACSIKTAAVGNPKRLSETRLIPAESSLMDVTLSKERFIKILREGGDNNKVRLVRIFNRGESSDAPARYRILDVKPDGIFAYLQLKELDLILAADDYIIPKPVVFWEYVKLIPNVGKASVEIERNGNNMLLNYTFKE